jgi:hypothetical protein
LERSVIDSSIEVLTPALLPQLSLTVKSVLG